MPNIFTRGSLGQNPPNADRHISSGGSDWAWAVFAIMLICDLVALFWTFRRARGTRLFHHIAVIVLTTATIAWFSMASDLGATPIAAEFHRSNTNTRQIWYVRYIQYFITFPLLLLELLLATGLSFSDIFTTLFMAWVVVVTALVGALVRSTYKWGYFALGLGALCYIWYVLLGHAPASFAAGGVMRKGYRGGAFYLSFLLLIYPIAWGVCEGSNTVSPTGEFIFYGILDLLAGPVFLFGFLSQIRGIDYGTFGFTSMKYSEGMYNGHGVGTGTGTGMAGRTTGPVNGFGGANNVNSAPGTGGNVNTVGNGTGSTGLNHTGNTSTVV
ncbi:heat shock protein 30 [Dichomitus squalens]|nr:heat shock protein 30 [Dichomitus squalens]